MRRSEHLQPDESICIICEGEKTEPYFFEELIAWMEREQLYRNYQYQIYPIPVRHDDSDNDNGGRKIQKRKLENPHCSNESVIQRGPMPECWVDSGIAQLKNFTEVWIAFDKDNHPRHQEAFEKVLQVRRSNNKLNLAFSSRCFETFLLQFFEYNTIPFLKSECDEKKNGKTRYFNCCLDNAVLGKACDGDKCINGYARKHGYWKNSKNGQSFSFINNLWQGIFNSHRLKWNSLATVNPMEEVYKRNPYPDTYRLVLRLLGCHSLEHGDFFCHKIGNGQYHYLQRKGNTVIFKNESKVRMTIPQSRISIMKVIPDGKPLIDLECQVTDDIAEIEVMPNEEYLLVLNDLLVSDNYYLKILWNEDYYFCAMEEGISNDFDMSNFDLSTC